MGDFDDDEKIDYSHGNKVLEGVVSEHVTVRKYKRRESGYFKIGSLIVIISLSLALLTCLFFYAILVTRAPLLHSTVDRMFRGMGL